MKIEIKNIIDSVKDKNVVLQEVMNSFATSKGDSIVCKKCGAWFIRGDWNFYNLCDTCFSEFDKDKMKERMTFFNKTEE